MDLFGAPGLSEQRIYLSPNGWPKSWLMLRPLSGQSSAMGLLRAIPPAAPVAPEFATDRGGMDTEHSRNLRLILSRFQ
jgi:hypothetical protein